ncbi:MAG: zeta toxin family protein [Bacteroidaceae bacterium]|nr:zeta toxin family protein [Bacteroidaceae bacterium]
MNNKTLYIIAGCNGAGKTTASYTVLPEVWQCREFVNADEIAKGLSPFNPESVAIEAGKLMLLRINELLKAEETFSIETTLSTKSYQNLIERAHANGYQVKLIFFWLDSSETAIKRVAQRVREGGHNIPTEVIIRRYWAGINNLFDIYTDKVDYWLLVNNTQGESVYIAEGGKNLSINIFDLETYNNVKTICQKQKE